MTDDRILELFEAHNLAIRDAIPRAEDPPEPKGPRHFEDNLLQEVYNGSRSSADRTWQRMVSLAKLNDNLHEELHTQFNATADHVDHNTATNVAIARLIVDGWVGDGDQVDDEWNMGSLKEGVIHVANQSNARLDGPFLENRTDEEMDAIATKVTNWVMNGGDIDHDLQEALDVIEAKSPGFRAMSERARSQRDN